MTLFSMTVEVSDQIEKLEEKETIMTLEYHNLSVNPEACERLAEATNNQSKENNLVTGKPESPMTPEKASLGIANAQFCLSENNSRSIGKNYECNRSEEC